MDKVLTHIQTCFTEKFGIPRQSLLVTEAMGVMTFPKNDFYVEAFRGIENYSHLWLIFEFHEAKNEGVKALVRPPRFLGETKFGVFATRSPHRPNHLGLSVVKFHSLEIKEDAVVLKVCGVDLLDGTPILDIKPYLPYADHVEARATQFERPQTFDVTWPVDLKLSEDKKNLITKVIGLDPRTSFDRDKEFGISLAGLNVRFKLNEEKFIITSVKEIE